MNPVKNRWRSLVVCLLIPLLVGALSALLTSKGMEAFGALRQPPLSPPAWLFPVVWTVLYVLMGLASWMVVLRRDRPGAKEALAYYGAQLIFNFFWSILFFGAGLYLLAFFWLLALLLLIAVTAVKFGRIHPPAGWILAPYLVWVSFAGYLNLGVFLLNR